MSMTGEIFEIEPFRHELEGEARGARGAAALPGHRAARAPHRSPGRRSGNGASGARRRSMAGGEDMRRHRRGAASGARTGIRRAVGTCPLAAIHAQSRDRQQAADRRSDVGGRAIRDPRLPAQEPIAGERLSRVRTPTRRCGAWTEAPKSASWSSKQNPS